MTAANNTAGDDRFVDVKERRGLGWFWWVAISLIVLLTALAGYLGLVASQWASHASDLQTTAADLRADIEREKTTIEQLKAAYDEARDKVDQTHPNISIVVDDKADTQDRQFIYADLSAALATCAKERVTQIGYVRDAYRYVPSSLAAYEVSLDSYCAKVNKSLNKVVKSETGEDE